MQSLESLVDPYDYFAAMEGGSRAERLFHPARLRLVSEITPLAGKQILEVGAGSGAIAIPLAEQGHRVTALEASQEHLDRLGGYARERHLEVPCVQGDARQMPFEDNSFDVVIVASLVHLLPQPDAMLLEATRVCRPDGRLIIAGPWRWHPKSMTWVKTLLRGSAPDGRQYPFTVRRLKRFLPHCVYLGSKLNMPLGYFATLWEPSLKLRD